jgi:predicted esterase
VTDGAAAGDRLRVRFPSTGHYRLRPGAGPDAPLLVAIHGYGQPADEMPAYAAQVAPPGWAVLAPEGPSSFYRRPHGPGGSAAGGVAHGWVADPDREAQDERNDAMIGACLADAARQGVRPSRVVLLGYSQGVGVAAHWWTSNPDAAVALVGLAGGVTAANRPRLARLAGRRVLWLTGERDVSYPPAYTAPMVEALRTAGVALDHEMLPEPHALLEPARERVRAWLRAL